MKTKRTQRYTGATWQGKGISAGYKATQSQDKPTSLLSADVKPFAGKVFYLDLPSNRITETLEKDIKELGGTVEKFFSKEIKYLVSNKREARYVQCLGQNSPFPSTDSGQSSPHPLPNPHLPGSHGGNVKRMSQDQSDTFVTSRGKSLVKRVVKEQERIQINKILSNALEWGVKILYIDDIRAYLQKKKKVVSSQHPVNTADKTNFKAESVPRQSFQKCKGGRISKPFVKVEDSSSHYCPIYLTMPNMPQLNLRTVPPCSPFFIEDKDPHGNKQWGHSRGVKASTSEDRAHGRKRKREKKGGGYCECCMIKYENITTHLQSERHKAFSKSEKYQVLDKLISNMRCNFIHIRTQFKRKCSVSSVLIPPGPCVKTGLRRKGDPDTPELIKEEQHQTIDDHKRSYLRRIESVPASAAFIYTEEDRRSNNICSERPRLKSLGCKRSCRQNSLTSCTLKASQNKMETAPPKGELIGSIPSRVTQVNLVNQELTEYMNTSASYLLNLNGQNEVPSKTLNITNPQEESELKQDFSVFDCVQDGNLFPEKIAENKLSEKKETNVPAQSFSPVPKIHRKINVYKRKRRKLDTYVEHGKPSDISENCRLKLWEFFQSSEDTDVEFPGFEDLEGGKKMT